MLCASSIRRSVDRAESGADVTVGYYTDREGAEQTAADCRAIGRTAIIVQGDVGDPDPILSREATASIAALEAQWPGLLV